MSEPSFFEKIKNEVRDPVLRQRLLEELNDHLEDAREQKTETSEKIFGEAKIIAAQTNSLTEKNFLLADIFIALFVGLITFILLNAFSTLISLVFDPRQHGIVLRLTTSFLGTVLYSSVAFIFYLVITKRFFIHYGQTISRKLLLLPSFYLPWILGVIEGLKPAFLLSETPFNLRLETFLIIIPAILLLTLFKTGDRWIIKNNPKANFWLENILKKLHFIIAPIIFFDFLVITNDWGSGDSLLSFVLMPIYFPLLVAYLFWGLSCSLLGWPITLIKLPFIFSFWIITFLIIFLTIVLPLGRALWQRKINNFQKIILAIFLPLFIMIPFVPHDVPNIIWQTPLVWRWETLEKQQLNIAYPWAAALMRQDDGINISYGATANEKTMTVLQAGGPAIIIARNQTIKIQPQIFIINEVNFTGGPPQNFSCDGEALENFLAPPEQNTGPLGMFGTGCHSLAYKNKPIAEIFGGSLIDLDLTSDGLLAISINMGSYDPTYVYVTDISGLME